MGRPMATNLIKAGHSLIVHSRSPQPVDALVALGAKRATSPADIARQVTRIITMVPDSPDVEQVLEGDNGIFSALQRGTILIDNSSIAPGVARRLAAKAKSLGAKIVKFGHSPHFSHLNPLRTSAGMVRQSGALWPKMRAR